MIIFSAADPDYHQGYWGPWKFQPDHWPTNDVFYAANMR